MNTIGIALAAGSVVAYLSWRAPRLGLVGALLWLLGVLFGLLAPLP